MALDPRKPNAADSLHECAMQAEEYLEKLATELAQVGAAPEAVKAVEQMAGVVRRIAKAVAKGGTQEEQPEQRPATMDQAADSMMADYRAQRGGQ